VPKARAIRMAALAAAYFYINAGSQVSPQWIGCHEHMQKRPAARERRYYTASICASRGHNSPQPEAGRGEVGGDWVALSYACEAHYGAVLPIKITIRRVPERPIVTNSPSCQVALPVLPSC
jgi:hypothetical protein